VPGPADLAGGLIPVRTIPGRRQRGRRADGVSSLHPHLECPPHASPNECLVHICDDLRRRFRFVMSRSERSGD